MAIKNKTITNSKTGQDIKFILTGNETNGQLLEMETTYNSHSKEPAAHYHPYQTEDFTVLSGQLTVRMDNQIKILKQGDTLHIPEKKVHAMWNNSDEMTIVNWKVQPALKTDNLLETASGLAKDGRTNASGVPNILQAALMLNKYNHVFRIAKPPFIIQRIIFLILTPFSYLFGYKPTYKNYLD